MTNNFKERANFIWGIADLLRGDYKQSEYGRVILPLTVLRRLDCVLEPTKQAVLDYIPQTKGLSPEAAETVLIRKRIRVLPSSGIRAKKRNSAAASGDTRKLLCHPIIRPSRILFSRMSRAMTFAWSQNS